MKNRLVSLFQLDDLLTATPNGHNGKRTKGHARKKRCRKGGLQATSTKPAQGTATPSAPAATPAPPPMAQSFDTGGAIHCEHAVPYPATPKVEVPTDDAGGSPTPHAQGLGIQVEAFEDDDDDGPTVTFSPDEDYPQAESDSVEEVYTPSVDRIDVEVPRMEVSEEAASFTAQMAAVESDLAELAERVQHPPPNSTPATPATDDEAAPAPTRSQASSKNHAIFDAMAKGMNYATEFRLPSLQLSQVFSALDRQLDAEPVPAAPVADATPAPVAMPGGDVLIADLVKLAPPPAVQTPAQSLGATINVRHEVQLVAQQTGFSCWAAGAAMVVGWRDRMSIDPSEIARATGYWAQYQTGLNAEDTHMFNVFRLKPEGAQTYTVQGFADLLKSYGPLWVASAEPGPHVRVVTGMVGDGTPMGTVVYINDPWEAGMNVFHLPNRGAQYTETYQRFVEKQETLGRQEIKQQGIYVAHA